MNHLLESQQIQQKLIQLIVSNQEPQTLLNSIVYELGFMFHNVVGADACLIVTGISETRLQTNVWSIDKEIICQSLPPIPDQSMVEDLFSPLISKTGPMEIGKVKQNQHKAVLEQLWQGLAIKSHLAMATQFQGNTNGIIFVGHHDTHKWTSPEKELLKPLGSLLGLAINLCQLQQQVKTNSLFQNLLMTVSKEIHQKSDLNSILHMTLMGTVKTLQVDRGLILKLRYKEPLLNSNSHQGIPAGTAQVICQCSTLNNEALELTKKTFNLLDSPLCDAAWQHSPEPLTIISPDQVAKITNSQDIPGVFPLDKIGSMLILPLMSSYGNDASSVVLGFIVLQHEQPRSWEADDIDLVEWVGIQASTAIIHNETLEQVKSLVEKRTAQLKWSLEIQSKLNEKMRKQLEELRRLNQVKDDFIARLSDELQHPLSKIRVAIEMLKHSSKEEQRSRYMSILEEECGKEINLVRDLLTLQNIESEQAKVKPQRIDLKLLIQELEDSLGEKLAEKQLNFQVNYHRRSKADSSLMLYTDIDSTRRILNELLTNASKFSAPDTSVSLTISEKVNQEHNNIIITITNTGSGISAEEQKYIFEPFRRGKNVSNGTAQGTGLGLALVKSLVEHLNGKIEVYSQPGMNSSLFINCFTLTMPQFQPEE